MECKISSNKKKLLSMSKALHMINFTIVLNHINELKKKISRTIGVLYKLQPFVTSKILSSIYYAIIYPFLLYGITIWGNAGKNLLTPILTLQNKFVCWQLIMIVFLVPFFQ